ncbi:MAG: DUF885 domain-containing protein [Marinicaulis sp.]|nr:DUF885 domain-containing protein [Marinicaulis sp.]NNE40065.1 DUF885 domain-containing protein [Marinicaulis sp.]NNL89063.1 DUF885 domain-containing protein [Marinicaulis sp.]
MKRTLKSLLAAGGAITLVTASPVFAQEPADPNAEMQAQSEDQRLSAFFEEIFQRELAESPIFQAQLGMKGDRYGEWDDFSDEKAVFDHEQTKGDLERLRAEFNYDDLSEQSKVSYRIFEFLQGRAIDDHQYRFHGYAFSTMNNPITFPVTFLQNIHRVDDVSDAEAYISRINNLDVAGEQLIDGINDAAERGIVPTSFSFDPVTTDAKALLKGAPFDDSGEDSAILADFRGKVDALDISDDEKARLIGQAEAALSGAFKTTVDNFVARVEELRDESHGPNGVWALPGGEDYYENRIRFWTTERGLTAKEIHKIGLKDVKRIRGEMKDIIKQVGFDGSLKEFFEFVRTDPSNFFPDTEEGKQAYLDQSKAYIDAIYEDVDQYFNVLPKAPLEVRAVEEWREETAPIAFYNRPTPDGSRPGIYYTNLKNMNEKQKHEMETVAYHEGAPGHHFQLAIQQELTGVPTFQKFAFFGAYSEGWGLYAERLAKEQGKFTDPMQDFGRLHNEIWRAIRLVVDTGIHSKKWTREKAIQYMIDNSPTTPEDAAKEIERYIDLPGQALSYKVGMIKILELRGRAEEELGDDYDIRDFHDVVLKNGAVALPILEELVDAYIAAKKAEAA